MSGVSHARVRQQPLYVAPDVMTRINRAERKEKRLALKQAAGAAPARKKK